MADGVGTMTREEAKKVLNTLENETLCCVCPFDIEECNDCENCIVNEALGMAIKSLSKSHRKEAIRGKKNDKRRSRNKEA